MKRNLRKYYINDICDNMATMFEYVVNDMGINIDVFVDAFVKTYGELYDMTNPRIVAGKSGIELARLVLEEKFHIVEFKEYKLRSYRTKEYWFGDYFGYYYSLSNYSLRDIFIRIKPSEIISMYPVYHEMGVDHFINRINEIINKSRKDTRLKIIRERKGYSQNDLSIVSGVKIKNIQMYEQRRNDINKAEAGALLRISKALSVNIEDLLETE